jgi:hypothetical protein
MSFGPEYAVEGTRFSNAASSSFGRPWLLSWSGSLRRLLLKELFKEFNELLQARFTVAIGIGIGIASCVGGCTDSRGSSVRSTGGSCYALHFGFYNSNINVSGDSCVRHSSFCGSPVSCIPVG